MKLTSQPKYKVGDLVDLRTHSTALNGEPVTYRLYEPSGLFRWIWRKPGWWYGIGDYCRAHEEYVFPHHEPSTKTYRQIMRAASTGGVIL